MNFIAYCITKKGTSSFGENKSFFYFLYMHTSINVVGFPSFFCDDAVVWFRYPVL